MPNPLRILTVIGARPQIIKAAAISRAIAKQPLGRVTETLLHTGQHYDANMSQVFFDELGIPAADINLNTGSGAHGATTAHMIQGIEEVLQRGEHDIVLLYGDTNSTLAGAIAAAKLHLPVAHVEAGLRSFNKRMPEELNRILCDHCSTWLFCPTSTALSNLYREGFPERITTTPSADHPRVMLSGDVMYDNSLHFAALARERSGIVRDLGLTPDGFALVTVHRDHNTDDPARALAIVRSLLAIKTDHHLPLVLPLHPRARKMFDQLLPTGILHALMHDPDIHILPPAGFLDMIALESHARLVITDSGGVQKESFFFQKPCVILRPETEWVELVEHGQAILADADPSRIAAAVAHFLGGAPLECPPLFGDGHAAERILNELLDRR